MIATEVQGGLGNQLFQYATARAVADRAGVPLVLDTRAFQSPDSRRFSIDSFRIRYAYRDRIGVAALLARAGVMTPIIEINAAESLDSRVLTASGWTYLRGYWQSPAYFAESRRQLQQDLVLVRPLSPRLRRIEAAIMGSRTSVAVHVRRGDYVTNAAAGAVHGTLPLDYYDRAFREIRNRVGAFQPYIFSDDPEWCRRNLPLADNHVVVSEGGASDAEELYLMTRCNHHVIANSTFSWWGAYLAGPERKCVVAPRRWFADGRPVPAGLLLSHWLVLP